MVTLATFMLYDQHLGGVIGLSGMQVLNKDVASNVSLFKKTPVFLYHGYKDNYFSVPNCQLSYKYIKENCKDFTLELDLNLQHCIGDEEMEKLGKWLRERM